MKALMLGLFLSTLIAPSCKAQQSPAPPTETIKTAARVDSGAEALDRPIPGTTKQHRLEENLGGTAVELTPDDLHRLNEATAAIPVQGARYSEGAQKMIDR